MRKCGLLFVVLCVMGEIEPFCEAGKGDIFMIPRGITSRFPWANILFPTGKQSVPRGEILFSAGLFISNYMLCGDKIEGRL